MCVCVCVCVCVCLCVCVYVCVCVVESMARRDIVLSEKTIILGSDVALITTKSSQSMVLEKRISELYILWILGGYTESV